MLLDQIDNGFRTVVYHENNQWMVDEEVKTALLSMFQTYPNKAITPGSWDKIPLKNCKDPSVRIVPGSIIRYTAYLAPNTVVMPSFINIGTYIGEKTMIDSMCTIGSCAYVGKQCHIGANVTIGGVLEPINQKPVIIEDQCFIGAQCLVSEGLIIHQGAVLGAGVKLTQSTRIIDRTSGETFYGFIPPKAVVVPGSYKSTETINIDCAIIIKYREDSIPINELLRS